MPPFAVQPTGIDGIKSKIECLAIQGDRLFMGTAGGDLHIYSFDKDEVTLLDTKKALCRKPIDQLGFIKDTNSLVVLSDTVVSLYALPSLSHVTPLSQTRGALVFALNTAIINVLPENTKLGSVQTADLKGIPAVVTRLAVGCRKKIVIFSWRDGEVQEPKELSLSHSPRAIAFASSNDVCLAYSQTEYVMLSLETMKVSEVTLPVTNNASMTSLGMGMGAFSGLGGYMTLGLGAKEKKPCIVRVEEGEVLVPRENTGVFLGPDGTQTRSSGIVWPGAPEETAYVKPYVLTLLPPGTIVERGTTAPAPPQYNSSILQIISTISLLPVQTLKAPFTADSPDTNRSYTARLLTPASQSKTPVFLISTPTDRTIASTEGSSLSMLTMQPWGNQIDELVEKGSYAEALALVESLDQAVLQDKDLRRAAIKALFAVSLFANGLFDDAINIFIDLNINPAKVVALYPESVAGRLSTPRERWFELYGGHSPPNFPTATPQTENFRRSVETLYRYLADRRPKLGGAMLALHITPAQASEHVSLSSIPVEELLNMPNSPPSALIPAELVRYAQVVDTALFKSYLIFRPSLLESLCRLPNWCEVLEVEQELRSRQKFLELIELYHGKNMHEKALDLLHSMSLNEEDTRDKLDPTIRYLQKLSPAHLEQIFKSSLWVLGMDRSMGLEIFTTEEAQFPRQQVADFLDNFDPRVCVRYLEYLINERSDTSTTFHERLAEAYLRLSLEGKKQEDSSQEKEMYSKLLKFVDESQHLQIDRLFGLLPSDAMFEARAILLGRLGKHQGALEIYVYRLHDYIKAEEYCKRIYHSIPESKDIFLSLLRIYLHSGSSNLLRPALELISRHSPRLDTVETLNLLPPMVTAQDLSVFMCEALRKPVFDTSVIREIWKSRSDQVSAALIGLQTRRVKITDSRICPQCHKRIGGSAIAVHAPRGEVTHYTCREAFSRKLNDKSRYIRSVR